MKVQEIMERTGMTETGLAIAYIKDALDEMNLLSETHTRTVRLDIKAGQPSLFYFDYIKSNLGVYKLLSGL